MSNNTPPPPTSDSAGVAPLGTNWPHLSHYLNQLIQSTSQISGATHSTTLLQPPQHPLSVSSSGSDGSDSDDANEKDVRKEEDPAKVAEGSKEVDDSGVRSDSGEKTLSLEQISRKTIGGPSIDKEELLRRVVDLLDNEREEEVKPLLKEKLPGLEKDDNLLDQICLDLMHKHKDDVEHLPYQPSVAPSRVRASPSIPHAAPLRPFTPTRVPSFRAHTPLGRPHSPAPGGFPRSGAATPTTSQPGTPTGGGTFNFGAGFASPKSSHSPLPGGSPLSSPRLLNAKAATYNSMASSSGTSRGVLGLPPPSSLGGASDPWFQPAGSRSASPIPTSAGLTRTSSNLAIAAPLTPSNDDLAFAFHGGQSPVSAGTGSNNRMPSQGSESEEPGVDDIFSTNTYSRSGLLPDDEEDDEFSPFGSPVKPKTRMNTSPTAVKLSSAAKAFDPTRLSAGTIGNGTAGLDSVGGAGMLSPSAMALGMAMHSSNTGNPGYFDREGSVSSNGEVGGALTPGGGLAGHSTSSPAAPSSGAVAEELSAGMTPLDVLSSVFTSLPSGELEDALMRAGYDFEGAMAILIAQNGGTRSGQSTPQRLGSPGPRPGFIRTASGTFRDGPGPNHFPSGGRGGFGMGTGAISPRFGMSGTRSPGGPMSGGVMVVNGQRVCRYFLAGECRRADCRFSHDVDRALCRFWLRGQCAKGDQCEFVHTLPHVDPHMLSNAMSRIELSQDGTSRHGSRTPPVDEFPDLHGARNQRTAFDPSRNRFANAVKKPMVQGNLPTINVGGSRFAPAARRAFPPSTMPAGGRTPPIAPQPRPSPRIKLRPPTLLPTLPTGAVVNDAYMEARSAALRLGHARNACLARAADAWRRGDGAAAKRFSREANVLNERMTSESAEAAGKLIKDRRGTAQEAIRARSNWSDDPADRAARGKECAGGLGVVMGVASVKAVGLGGSMLSVEERTECLLDLHALHANEGVELLEEFLVNLEREGYLGLAYVIIGDDRHTGTQDPARGASRFRLSTGVKQFLARWGYPWSEGGGVLCIDSATHF